MDSDILGTGSFKINDDLLVYAGCSCSYEGSGEDGNGGGKYILLKNDILGGGSLKINDDLLIYAGCKCSYEGSGTPVNPNSLLEDENAA